MDVVCIVSESRIVADFTDSADFKHFLPSVGGYYLHRSVFRGRMKIEKLNWVGLGVNCLNRDL